MTGETIFPHHRLSDDSGSGDYELVSAEVARPLSDPLSTDVTQVRRQLRSSGVVEIKLIHGTFVGNDATGLIRALAGVSPRFNSVMLELSKRWTDQLAGEVGNFTDLYASLLSQLVNTEAQTQIRVSRFLWSGENHHLGRALAVVLLFDEILARPWKEDDRMLLMAHSHGGNVLAMMSLVVGSSRKAKEEFIGAIDNYIKCIDEHENLPDWERVREHLLDEKLRSKLPRVDVVTLGTPLRYRWNTTVCQKLMHIVHHCPLNDKDQAKSEMPGSIGDVFNAAGGDYVQHVGIAGTDFPHPPMAREMRTSENALRRMFERDIGRRDLIERLSRGYRTSLDGKTFLVDYASSPDNLHQKLCGHGIYTCSQWLPFHLRLIADQLYAVQL